MVKLKFTIWYKGPWRIHIFKDALSVYCFIQLKILTLKLLNLYVRYQVHLPSIFCIAPSIVV